MSSTAPTKWLAILERIVANCKVKSRDLASDADGQGASIKLWGSQRRLLEKMAEGMDQGIRTFVCLKSRQLGITTIMLIIDVAWLAMHPGIMGALVVHNGGAKEKMRQQLQDIVASFPANFFGSRFAIKKGRNNRDFMEFSNGSRIDFIVAGEKDSEKETFGDGSGYALVHLTEVALYASVKALASFEQTFSSNHPNRLIVYESRAAGFNHWKDMWVDAGRDHHTKKRIFIGWWAREDQIIRQDDRRFPAYGMTPPNGEEAHLMNSVWHLYGHRITPEQLAWYRHRASDDKMTTEIMHAQQPWDEAQAFVAGGYSFFSAKQITDALGDMHANPEFYTYRAFRYIVGNDFFSTYVEEIDGTSPPEQRKLRVWEFPVKGGKYAIGFDPAFGRNDNKDRHSISVWRCYADCMVQVAEFADNECITSHAAWVMCHLAGSYEDCVINLELTGGPGQLVMQELDHVRALLADEMYAPKGQERKIEEFLSSARWYLYHRPDSMGAGYMYNTQTSASTKLPMMESFRAEHRGGNLLIRSDPLLREMMDVRQEGIRVEAPGGSKDDRVVAAALANMAWKRWLQPQLLAIGATYESQQRLEAGGAVTFTDVANVIVRKYLEMCEVQEEAIPRAPQWMIDRGLA